jgi:hypothetical protein
MTGLVLFTPRENCDAKKNLTDFISLASQELIAFGQLLVFHDPVWDVSEYVERKSDNTRCSLVFDRLDKPRKKCAIPSGY